MPKRMPMDRLDEDTFVAREHHPLSLNGTVSAPFVRQLARTLIDYREDAKLSQIELAQKVGFSHSKISRIESCESRASVRSVLKLLETYGLDSGKERDDVIALAKEAYEAHGNSAYNSVISPEYRQYLEHEAVATIMRVYRPLALPRFLQTQAYTDAIDARMPDISTTEQSQADKDLLHQLETQRAEWLLGPHGPKLLIILGAAALGQCRNPALIDGLQRLNTAGQGPTQENHHLNRHIAIQIAPNSPDNILAAGQPFDILSTESKPLAIRFDWPGNSGDYDLTSIRAYQYAFDYLGWEIPDNDTTVDTLDTVLDRMYATK